MAFGTWKTAYQKHGNGLRMNLLKVNDDKTEFILTGTHQQLDNVSDLKIHTGTDTIYPVKAVWKLGFHQDSELKKPFTSTNLMVP